MSNQSQPFLLPNTPLLDKLGALYVLLTYVVKQDLAETELFFYDVNEPLPHDVIDVDARSDYKSAGFRSATQRILDDAPYKALGLRSVPGMDHFAACFDLNNSPGAVLKKNFPNNLFNLVREWPRVGHNVQRDQHLRRVIETVFGVFDLYFMAAQLDQSWANGIKNPFCLDSIKKMQDKTQCAWAEQQLEELQHYFSRTAKAGELTRKRAEAIKPEFTFEISTKGDSKVGGAVYRTDDRALIGHLFDLHPETHVFIMKHRSGNVIFMSRGKQDFSQLANVLNEMEPERWHYETRYPSPFLANGGGSRSKVPTDLTPSELRDLLIANFKYTTRSQDMIVR